MQSEFTFGDKNSVCAPVQGESFGLDLIQILDLYLAGPVSDNFRNPFPDALSVVSLEQNETFLSLVLDDSYAMLQGIDLSLANACLYKTCSELTGLRELRLRTETLPIDGEEVLILHQEDFVMYDHYVTIPTE